MAAPYAPFADPDAQAFATAVARTGELDMIEDTLAVALEQPPGPLDREACVTALAAAEAAAALAGQAHETLPSALAEALGAAEPADDAMLDLAISAVEAVRDRQGEPAVATLDALEDLARRLGA